MLFPLTFSPLPTSSLIARAMTANHPISATNNRQQEKVVLVMGATGPGKRRLSIDLENLFIDHLEEERLGVAHHLLEEIDSASHGEFTPAQFRARGSQTVSWITGRGLVPHIVRGFNSFIYAPLTTEKYNPDSDVLITGSEPVSNELDVSLPVLDEYLKKRVDEVYGEHVSTSEDTDGEDPTAS